MNEIRLDTRSWDGCLVGRGVGRCGSLVRCGGLVGCGVVSRGSLAGKVEDPVVLPQLDQFANELGVPTGILWWCYELIFGSDQVLNERLLELILVWPVVLCWTLYSVEGGLDFGLVKYQAGNANEQE